MKHQQSHSTSSSSNETSTKPLYIQFNPMKHQQSLSLNPVNPMKHQQSLSTSSSSNETSTKPLYTSSWFNETSIQPLYIQFIQWNINKASLRLVSSNETSIQPLYIQFHPMKHQQSTPYSNSSNETSTKPLYIQLIQWNINKASLHPVNAMKHQQSLVTSS